MPSPTPPPIRRERAGAPSSVFVGLLEIAGYYAGLATGLAQCGVRVAYVDLSEHRFGYAAPRPPALARAILAVRRRRLASRRAPVAFMLKAVEAALRVLLFVWAAARFEAFVFGYGATFLGRPDLELPLLRLLGKRTVCIFHGSDSRPPYLDGSLMAADRGRTVADCVTLTRAQRARVDAIDRWASAVVDNPLSSQFHARRCVNWFALGVPTAPGAGSDARPAPRRAAGAPLRVLHCPSHPEAKGSAAIRAAVEGLRARGFALEYVEIVGRPNAEVLAALDACDLVVDQLYSDTPLAGFATEAARRRRPVVVGGYGAAALAATTPAEWLPPSLYVHPDDVENAIARLAADPAAREACAESVHRYVSDRWSADGVAERLLRVLAGEAPPEWTFDPAGVVYPWGCALSAARARELVAQLVETAGPGALCVADKPALEQALLGLAREAPAAARATRRAAVRA